jgi:thiol-disulfide isomerase/thioredoxin
MNMEIRRAAFAKSGVFRVLTLLAPALLGAVGCDGGGSGVGGKGAASPQDTKPSLLGAPAPDFNVIALNGDNKGTVSIAALKGKVVILDVWATWCAPCREEFPKLEELNVTYKPKGLEILAVSADNVDDVKEADIVKFALDHGAKFAVGWDKDGSMKPKYHPQALPSAYVIDRNGIVRYQHIGYQRGEEKDLEREVKELLDESK